MADRIANGINTGEIDRASVSDKIVNQLVNELQFPNMSAFFDGAIEPYWHVRMLKRRTLKTRTIIDRPFALT